MSDTWQYRVRVIGPDRKRWWKEATSLRMEPRDFYFWVTNISWEPDRANPRATQGTWYNVKCRNTPICAEFSGNFSQTPRMYFEKDHRLVVGPSLFGDMNIEVEVVGFSHSCDTKTGVYSYRDTYASGALVSSEKADDLSIAEEHAPELLARFPKESL